MPYYRSIGNRKPMGYISWFLMVFITLKLIVFKKIIELLTFLFLLSFVSLLASLSMEWSHIFFGELQVILFIFSFIWRYVDFVIKFCFFLNGH